MNSKQDPESDSEEDFKWEQYLKETNSTAAPAECFQQASVPPENKFQERSLLEAADPRYPSMFCAATVISKYGPKIRLRMLGAGSNDDFWTIVDSKLINPIGFTEQRGGFLQPPFNSQRDTTRWANYLKKTLSAPDAILAPNDCFMPEPPRPTTNKFQVGQKLEACDLKDTTFVCPATVVEVKGDRIRIEFDGWNVSDLIRYDSREIFPVGWWEKAGISINPPPKQIVHGHKIREAAKKPHNNTPASTPSTQTQQQQQQYVEDHFSNIFETVVPPSIGAKKESPPMFRPFATDRDSPPSTKPSTPTEERSASTGSAASVDRRLNLPKHTARKSTMQLPSTSVMRRPDVTGTPSPLSISTAEDGKLSAIVPSPKIGVAFGNGFSGSKRKAASPSANHNSLANSFETDDNNQFTVFVNSSCATGKYLNADKLASAQHCYGPGPVNHVMRSCLQLLIDCAKDTGHVYHSMPSGDGRLSVEADFSGSTRVRHLPVFHSVFEGWKCLASVLDCLQTCPHLFSDQLSSCLACPATNASLKKAKLFNHPCDLPSIDFARKRHGSGESSSSTCTEREMTTGVDANTVLKWNVDDVVRFVCSVGDTASSELFKKQEIDGKALLLLTADMMIRYMNVRLGPALKIANAIEKLKTSPKTSVISD